MDGVPVPAYSSYVEAYAASKAGGGARDADAASNAPTAKYAAQPRGGYGYASPRSPMRAPEFASEALVSRAAWGMACTPPCTPPCMAWLLLARAVIGTRHNWGMPCLAAVTPILQPPSGTC